MPTHSTAEGIIAERDYKRHLVKLNRTVMVEIKHLDCCILTFRIFNQLLHSAAELSALLLDTGIKKS